jgi:predicted cobalt transporter CbtA
MPAIIEGPPEPDAPAPPLWKRLVWFVAIAAASTVGVAAVAYGLKALLPVG